MENYQAHGPWRRRGRKGFIVAKAFMQPIRAKGRKAALADMDSIARKEIKAAMDGRIKPALVKSLEKVVEDWEHQPGFQGRLAMKQDKIAVYVWPTGDDKMIFIYVDKGTKPHRMPAVDGKLMVFQLGGTYVPKTMAKPARTVVGGGKVVGGVKTFTTKRKAYVHPGSEGRGFTEQIAKDIAPFFKREIDAAFKRAARQINGG
jgi:hypothetical protein